MTGITRRTFCEAIAVLALVQHQAFAKEIKQRPNILLLISDDWSWQNSRAIDCLGLKLPTFERIKRDGINFTNAFAAAPTCTASRGAILTGRPIYQLEQGANLASTFPVKFDVYTELLAKQGYHVGFSGKGWAPGQIAPGGRTQNPAGKKFADFDAFLAERNSDTPFCFWFGSRNPHRPFAKGEGKRQGIMPAAGAVPSYLPDAEPVREDIADYMASTQDFDKQAGELLAKLEKENLLDNTLVVITGDNGWAFPRAKATLYDAGTHVPLAMMWKKGIRPQGNTDALVSLADLAPTFMAAGAGNVPDSIGGRNLLPFMQGGKPPHRSIITAMERHMDGGEKPLEGYPMRAIRTQEYLYIRNFKPDRWPAGRPNQKPVDFNTVATKDYAGFANIDAGPSKAWLVANRNEPGVAPLFALATGKRADKELYHVVSDPDQLKNLAGDPQYAAVLQEMDEALMKQLREEHDPRVVGGGDNFDSYPFYCDPGFERPADF